MRVAVIGLFLCALAFAQVDTGVITGRIQDNAAGVVPGARVVVTNTGTNYRVELTANSDGVYFSPSLPAGNYRVDVTHPGFRPMAKTLPLNLSERVAVDFTLEIGAVTETIAVQETIPVLQTENTTLSTLRSEREVKSLPINSRNFAELIRFTPGVVPGQATKLNLALSQQRGNVSNTVNGVSIGDNNFLVDGLQNNNNHQGWGIVNYPEFEAIEQYRIETSVPDSRFGRAGATVNVGYKSGTNELHGVLFEFLRNSTLDARNFFASGAKPPLKRNLYGGTLGGPIGGKNAHTFFFVSYEGQRSRAGLTFLTTVPTASMRTGNFSELLTGARPLRIYDPLTAQRNPGGGASIRDLFPGNIIPAARFNSTSKKIIDMYPSPNGSGLASNFLLNPPDARDTDQGSVKVDHDFNAGSRAFSRLTRSYSRFVNGRALGEQATPFIQVEIPVTQAVLSYARILSPRVVNQARFGLSREPIRANEMNGDKNLAQEVGIPNVNVDELTRGLPIISVNGIEIIGAKDNTPAIIVSQNTQWGDNLDIIRGNHNLKTGFDVVFRQTNAYQSAFSRGQFTFSTLYTSNPAAPAGTGFGAADLLLGKPQQIALNGLTGTRGLRRQDWGMFLQDDWKITQRLTLNFGIRYEIAAGYPNYEVADRMLQFDMATGLPAPVGTGKFSSRSGGNNDLNNWAPRAGLSFRLGAATVLRAAYGVYYSLIPIPIGDTLASNPPLFVNSLVANNQDDFAGARAITDGPLRSVDPNTPGQNRVGISPDFRVPYVQQWNVAVQRQLPGQQQLTAAYVGTKGTGLLPGVVQATGVNYNQAVAGDGAVNNRRRWPQYGAVRLFESRSNSSYHSLQATLVKRWSNSLHYQFAYTWSHVIDDLDISNLPITNLHGARGTGDNDVRHQVRTTFGYELPFGKGKHMLNSSRVANAIAGGWEVNGILTLYSGFPFSVASSANTLNIGEGTRADRVRDGNLPVSQRTVDRWFDLDAFANPGFRLFGYGGRNILEGPGTKALDFSLFKNMSIRETKKLQFRAEVFNITNTPQFNLPVGSIGSGNSGRITSAGSEATLQRTQRQIQLALKLTF